MTQTIENFPGLFSTKSEFLAFKQAWKALAHKKSITKEDVLLRMVLLGKPVLSALPYPTNKLKLENGGIYGSGVTLALNMFQAYREKSTTSQNFAAKWAVSLSPQTYAKALERIREKGAQA